jgi:hypothetical protein
MIPDLLHQNVVCALRHQEIYLPKNRLGSCKLIVKVNKTCLQIYEYLSQKNLKEKPSNLHQRKTKLCLGENLKKNQKNIYTSTIWDKRFMIVFIMEKLIKQINPNQSPVYSLQSISGTKHHGTFYPSITCLFFPLPPTSSLLSKTPNPYKTSRISIPTKNNKKNSSITKFILNFWWNSNS